MNDKALISSYTYRPLEAQRETYAHMPVFVLPDDLPQLVRPTTRKVADRFHVERLANLAKDEGSLRDFMAHAKERKAVIISREDEQTFRINGNVENLVKWWKDARRKGSSKIGGERGAQKKKAAVAERAKGLTKEEWTNGSIKNAQLVQKYDVSINALKGCAADKGWGHDRQRAIWRAEQRTAKRETKK